MSTIEEDFSFLGGQGYTGTINDRMFAYLGDLGYTGALNDRLAAYHAAQGNASNWLNLTGPGEDLVTLTIDDLTFTSGDPSTLEIDATYTGSGTLTAYAVTGTDPVTVTKDQLKAGSGGTGTLEFFNFAVTAPNDIDDITGLTSASNSADRILVVIEDANGVRSAVEEVTVSGLSFGLTLTHLLADSLTGPQASAGVYEFTGVTHGTGKMYVGVGQRSSGAGGAVEVSSATFAGQSASLVTDGSTSAKAGSSGTHMEFWAADVTAGTSTITINLPTDANQGVAIHAYLVEGSHSVGDVTLYSANPAEPVSISANVDTVDGGIVLLGACANGASGFDFDTYTGVTKDGASQDLDSGDVSVSASASAVSAETPRVVGLGESSTSSSDIAVVSVAIDPT